MLQKALYYCLKAAHQYKFNQIFSFLTQFDLAIEVITENKDEDLFVALLQTSSDTRLVQLYLSILSKNVENHPFQETILALPSAKKNLIPLIISAVNQTKNDNLLLSIYNNDTFHDAANQNNLFISKLVAAIISKNNVFYINALKSLLTDAKNKHLLLSQDDIFALYIYCTDYNLLDLQQEMLNNESIFVQLLTNNQFNKLLFDKLIRTEQFFDYIKVQEVKAAFQLYLEKNTPSFSDESLPNAHQLILHPYTRELLPATFTESVIRRTIQLSKKTPTDLSLKTFIFNIIEFSYVTNLTILTLKSLIHYCITYEKLDEIFYLEKHQNFSQAFDQDLYVETFQLALELKSKHLENLAAHHFYYNLDFQSNFKLLCYFIKKDKCLNLFQKLFEDSFYAFFTPKHYQAISKVMLTCSATKLPEKNDISNFAKTLLSNYKIHAQRLDKFIDLRALIQDQQLYSFHALGKYLNLLTCKIDLIKLMQSYPTTQIQSIIGLHFQLNQEIVEEVEKDNVKILGNIESAQNQKLIHKANRLFSKVEQAFQKTFNGYGENHDARVIAIEKEIKIKLLEFIYLQAKEQEENKIDINRQKKIIEYINEHKENLLLENELVMTGFRKILINIYNPMDITHFQTAWLSYDKGFVREELFEGNWDNYRKFFVAPPDIFADGGAYSAGEHSLLFTNKLASQEVRKRACYYWLVVNDPEDPVVSKTISLEEQALAEAHKVDTLKFRVGNFFGIISSIYRTNGFGISTCYPGHLTAIMNMGLQHTLATPIGSIEMIEHLTIPVIRNYIKGLMEESTTWDGETKAQKVDELLVFKSEHAKSLIIQSIQLNNKYNTFYQTVYANIDKLRELVWESLPEDFIKDEDSRKIKALIENAILGFSTNPFIHDCIMEDILNSPCIIKDFSAENDNVYLLNTRSTKYRYFEEFYHCVFKSILNSTSTIMPTIGQKGLIIRLVGKIVNELTASESLSESKINKVIKKLATISFPLPIDQVKQLILEKKSPALLLPAVEQQNRSVLFSYPESLKESTEEDNNEIVERKEAAVNSNKKSFS